MRTTRLIVVGLVAGAVTSMAGGLGAAPASAALSGNCAASAMFVDSGVTVDAPTDEVVTVRRADTVQWEASSTAPPGVYEGSMHLELPAPFGNVRIESWQGDSQTMSNSGTDTYDLPSLVPGGAKVVVSGRHDDVNGRCAGSVTLRIEGSALSSPLTWIGLGGAFVSGVGFLWMLRILGGGGVGMKIFRGLFAAVLGLLFLLFVGIDLVIFGAIASNSALVTVLAVAGLFGGGAIGAVTGGRRAK